MQIKIYLNILFVFCILSTSIAQSDYSLLNHVKKLETKVHIDPTNTTTINEIISDNFAYSFTDIPNKYLAKPNETYWFKINLDSIDLSAIDRWYISFRYYDEIILYVKPDGYIDSISGGLRSHPGKDVNDFTDIPFTKEQLIDNKFLFAKVRNFNNAYFIENPLLINDFYISFYEKYFHRNYFIKQIPFFIFIGGISLILFYFIGIFFLYRDTQFIIYSLYLLSLLLYLGVKASLIQDIFRMNAPFFIYYYNSVIQVIVNIFYSLFAIAFLNARKDFPILYKFIRGTIYLLIGIVLLQTILYIFWPFSGVEEKILKGERYYMIMFSLGAYVYIIKNYTDKLALFFVGGSFIFLTGATLAFLFRDIHLMMYGAAIEVFVFSLAMGYRIKQIENEKKSIENEMTKVELTALRAQMNPHFIFNSLNSIRAYVISNEIKKASGYITKFSKLIRLILYYSANERITLHEEIEALRLYVQLEELRFRENFGFEVNIGEELDLDTIVVPPLIIQPYVENAIRHGLTPKDGNKKLCLNIEGEKGNIVFRITDNGVGRQFNKPHSEKPEEHISMAMELTKKRINLTRKLYSSEENIIVNDLVENGLPTGTEVILKFPCNALNSAFTKKTVKK